MVLVLFNREIIDVNKKKGYKYQVEQALIKSDWRIISIDSNKEWWDDEHWRIEFKYDAAITFYLCFIVDPMFEGQRKQGEGVY